MIQINNNTCPNGIIDYEPTNKEEILRFWAVLMALPFSVCKALDDVWATESTSYGLWGMPIVPSLLSKNRFHQLMAMLQVDVPILADIANAKSVQYWNRKFLQCQQRF